MHYDKQADPYSYVKAEDFFNNLDSQEGGSRFRRVERVELHPDQFGPEGEVTHPACHHGRAFHTNGNKILLIDFVRPTAFRIRFSPKCGSLDSYLDNNSRNLVKNTMKKLVDTLDHFERLNWEVVCEDTPEYIILESRSIPIIPGEYNMRIYIRKERFKIIVVQPIARRKNRDDDYLLELGAVRPQNDDTIRDAKIVWQTKVHGILYDDLATVIEVNKPSMANYLGFGEQGGRQLLKTKVVVDYFNYDNMTYSQVYGQGPMDSREPLYHSEPFWMEIRQHPEHMLKVASFVDNFSQVCLDIGTKDNSSLRVATRFNSMRLFVIADESIGRVINTYTLIVGRPRLKPRYVLGYHQGCYGYDSSQKIEDVVKQYRELGFPLDGIHIDVDIQRDYKTFTVDESRFPNPRDFFTRLREQGVKCSTNITPFINGDEDSTYSTLTEGINKGYFVKDKRYLTADGPHNAHEDKYALYCGGQRSEILACDLEQEPRKYYTPVDDVHLATTWNTGKPFRGGVWYGRDRGRPGYYPDLNRREVRRWWGKQYEYLISLGLEFVWQDMTSPCMGASYGDMRSFPFRLLLTSDATHGISDELPAIQIWSLYAFNLHKATYRGWYTNPEREKKRNFIIGRGGYIGLHRFAGLWTGDNASDWDFLKVSVAQVLSLGLSGITISGGDVGGFEPGRDGGKWASPELVMRWYCAYSLLPWFRNHYNGKAGKKLFQASSCFKYTFWLLPERERWLYEKALPVCQYYVQLRYTLLQLLYDQMFDNLFTGLPIARSLVISNEDDSSLVAENSDYLDDEYTVGDDLLVAPVLHPQGDDPDKPTRTVYLPRPHSWWQCNLRAGGALSSVRLDDEFKGGSLIPYRAHMNRSSEDICWITPMFIRFGAIIPQIEPSLYAEDWANQGPLSVHIYPGHLKTNKFYDMYLDDGVSAATAPTVRRLRESLAPETPKTPPDTDLSQAIEDGAFGDDQAKNVYWKIRITQTIEHKTTPSPRIIRRITVETKHQHHEFDPVKQYGQYYRLIIWGAPKRASVFKNAQFISHEHVQAEPQYDEPKNAWFINLPIHEIAKAKYDVECSYSSRSD
ncbi:glycoside hydrolase family 31 protein [Ceratobasidium sp. AG-Ba]|nr:glycoside hydrolase family 31 protein [Ceratobasidium sp. AG-Ba]